MMHSQKLEIWGREFDLEVRFYNYDDEEVTPLQKQTADRLPSIDFNKSKTMLDQYILENNRDELGRDDIDNIFKYVIPKYILVFRTEEIRTFALMCNYRFDPEHGLAILFEEEGPVSVTPQDDVL